MAHVLIVDDELSIRETFQAFLEKDGYDVTTAADFFEAESFLARLPSKAGGLDVVVADIVMPHTNGLALLQRVREIDADIPVIMITGEPDVSTAAEAVRSGAYDYVAKPVTQRVLNRVVGRAAEKKHLLDEQRRLEAENRAYQADLEQRVAERTAELEQRNQELGALIEIGRDISATLDLNKVFKRVTQRTAQACGAHRCTILMLAEDGESLIPLMSQFSDGHADQEMWHLFKDVRQHTLVSQVPEAQQVIREQRPLFIPDTSASSLPRHWIEPLGIKSMLITPLISKEQVIGLMALDQVDKGREFTAEQADLVTAITAQAATAIENARLYKRQQQRVAQRARMLELSRELRLSLDLPETLNRICQAIVKDLGWQQAILSLRDYETKTSRPVAMTGYDAETVARTLALPPTPFGELDILRKEFRISHSYYIDHQHRDAIADYPDELIVTAPAPDLKPGGWHPDDMLLVPIEGREGILGFISPDNPVNRQRPTLQTMQELETFAAQAATVIENARLFEKEKDSRRLANTLREIAQALNSTLSLNDVLGLILAELEKVIAFDNSSIMLLEDKDLVVYAVKGFASPDNMLNVRLDLDTAPLNYEVVESKRPLIVGSVHEDGRWLKSIEISGLEPELRDIHSWMGIPLLIKGRVIGMLTTDKVEAHFYDEQDAEIASTFANQAAIAIQNARLFEAEKRRVAQLKAISEIGKDIASILDLDELLHRVVGLLVSVFGYYYTNILMMDEEAQEIVLTASAGQTGRVFEGYRLKIGEQGITGWVAGSGKPLLVNDVDQEPRYHHAEGLTNTRSELALPIKLKEKVVGVMDVQSNRLNAFDEMDLSTLTTLADQVAIAIENARLLKETRKHVALLERTTRDLELVHQVSQVISSSLDLTHILEATVEQMVAVFEADHSGVLLFDQAQTHGQVVAEYPPTGATAEWFPVQGYLAAERIIADREPLVIKDTWNDPLMATVRETMHRLDIRSMLIAPLIVKGKVMGSIGLDAVGHQRCFDAEEVALAQTIANQVSIVIENARLFEETKQRAEEMTALHETTLDITAQLEMPRLLDAIIARASDLMGATGGMVHFYDPARERLVAVTSHNLEKDYTGLTLEAGEGVAGKVFQTGKPLIVDDHRTWAKKSSQVTDAEARSTLGMPLKWQGQIIGVLDIMDNVRVGAFDEHDLQRLAPFANQAAIAIQNARLFEETRRHAVQLEAASKVARDATAILDIGQLLDETVHLISDRFGFYHAGVFLVDEQREYALLRAASSKGGQCMLEQGHKLAVGKVGIVGYVAGTGEPRIVLDVGKDAVFFDNPNLPDTRSEMALPLISRGQIVGVLDIQSTQEAAFTEEDVVTLQTMADQLANAIQNARLLEETQQRAQQLEALTEIGRAIGSTLDLDEVLQLILAQAERVVPYDAVSLWLREGETMRIQAVRGFEASAAHLGLTLTVADDALVREIVNTQRPLILADAQQDERFHSLAGTDWVRSWLGVPLLSKEQVIGLITINAREADLYAEGMAELALALGRQAAIAIENARLYEETKRRADEMTVLYHTSLEIGVPTDLPDLLWTLCDRAAGLLGVDKGGLYLYDEAREELELVVSYKLEQDFTGTRLKLGEGVAGRVVQTGQPLTVDDYSHWEGRAPVYEKEPFVAVIAVPLRWQERIIGAVSLSEETERRTFTPDDERLLGLFAQQAAVVIESARLYEEARRRVEELVALHAIDVTIASTLNLDEMLQRIYEQVSTVMNTTTFHIALYDEEKGELYLPIIVDQGKQLPPRTLQVEDGLSGWVVRTREPLWIEDMERERDTLPAKCIALGAPTRSLMVLPLIAKDKVVGVISAQSHEPHAFDADHRHLFSGIASQVAIAIENARLFEETSRRLNELSLLHDVALTSTATLNFDEILCHTVESVHSKLQLDVFGFLLVDEEAGIVRLHPTFLGVPDDAADFTIPLGEGITGWVAQTGHPLLAPDVSQEPRYRDTIPGIRSEVCVPLKIGDKVIGVINAESTRLNAFSEDDVRLFSTLASQLGVALENARLFEETNRRLAETRLLQEMMQAAASTLDFDQVLTRTIETLRRTLDVDYLGFALLDDSGTAMIPHPSMIGFPTPPEGYLRLPLNESIIGRVYQTGEPLLTADVSQIPYYFEVISEIRSELAVPVRVGDKVVGVLNVESHALAAFDEDDLHLFTAIAAQLGVVLENTRLYQTLQERTEELSQAYEELKELDRLRTELVQNVGHELRTPLTLVQGYVELLLAGDLGHISDSQWAALQIVHERTDTLVRLIHNLTMLQTMPRETLMPVSVSVVEVVRHALTGFRHFADKVGVALREELPSELPPVMGDQEQLELAFSHLVDNAVKFSPDGGTITLRAWADKAWVYVSVADEGIGIAPDHLDNIFERFYQVDGTPRRRFGGMGIGLAVVWEIVEAHGGTVNVESKPEKGSTFTVALARA